MLSVLSLLCPAPSTLVPCSAVTRVSLSLMRIVQHVQYGPTLSSRPSSHQHMDMSMPLVF